MERIRTEAPVRSERLRRSDVVRKRSDFQRCYQRGVRLRGRFLTLFVLEQEKGSETQGRLGITITRKAGPSVVRHRLRRRLREIFRRWPGRKNLQGLDLVVHTRPAAATLPFASLRGELERLLSRLQRGARERRASCAL